MLNNNVECSAPPFSGVRWFRPQVRCERRFPRHPSWFHQHTSGVGQRLGGRRNPTVRSVTADALTSTRERPVADHERFVHLNQITLLIQRRIPYFYLGTTWPLGHSVSAMTVAADTAAEKAPAKGLFPSPAEVEAQTLSLIHI